MKNFNPWYMLVSILSAITLLMGNLGLLEKQEEKTRFIAHRGYSSQYLENTEEAFIKAAEVGFDGCETDVTFSKDGVLMLAHSGAYEYEDGSVLSVRESTFAELTAKPLKNEFTDTVLYPCTFRRYIEIMRDHDLFAFIELKGEYPEAQLRDMVETVNELYTWDMCSVQSMQMENLLQLRGLYPEVPLMFCGGGYSADVGKALQYGFDCDLLIPDIFPVVLRAFQLKGLRTAVWTANDKKAVSWALWLGVDFIESDYLWGLNAA